MLAYHFLRDNMTSGSDLRPWVVGEERTLKGRLILCGYGYHYSPTARDALYYAEGPILCLVDVDDDGPQECDCPGAHKGVSRRRKLLAAANVERELRLFACECAERAITRCHERGCEPDPRSLAAVEVAKRYAEGNATEDELQAAQGAASDAASAATLPSPWTAAMLAAQGATTAAPWGAWTAELDWQRRRLAELVDGKLRQAPPDVEAGR